MGLTHGGFVGTPAFASPEQFTNERVDVRSDIYSLGVTLWCLLTGQTPFPGSTLEQIRDSQREHALPLEQLKAARVPACFVTILLAMLATEPAARPGIRELTTRLQRCRAQLLDRWKVARRLAFAAAAMGLIATAGFMLVRPSVQPEAAPATAVSPKSIAVLPFRTPDSEQAYFADGIQGQILTRLAGVADLKVISRTSTEKYRSTPPDMKNAAEELGVDISLTKTQSGMKLHARISARTWPSTARSIRRTSGW
ncbi:hypothetical protein BH20VER1_BH20VER1_25910 [soil metagenome]